MIENYERLKKLNRRQLQQLYYKFFTSDEGKLILEDLRFQCYFYTPTNGPRDEGKEDVIKYIQEKVTPINESVYDEEKEIT